jgi:hypothetical protein
MHISPQGERPDWQHARSSISWPRNSAAEVKAIIAERMLLLAYGVGDHSVIFRRIFLFERELSLRACGAFIRPYQ